MNNLRLKLRVWTGNNLVYIPDSDLEDISAFLMRSGHYYIEDSRVYSQYIGVKDSDNTDIYMGDVIQWERPEKTRPGICPKNVIVELSAEYSDYHPNFVYWNNYEQGGKYRVIGNIFENPEFIEEE